MGTHEQQLRNPLYRAWVKAGLALKYLKDGIETFVDEETKNQQKSILQEVQKEIGRPDATCDQCPISVIQSRKRGRYITGGGCPSGVCDRIFDKIVLQHIYGRPSWINTDSRKWCANHWEIAKCFLDGGGYAEKVSAADTDCKGLLSIVTNNMFVQNSVDTPIDRIEPKTDVFSKSKEARNEILHHASLQLQVEKLNNYIDDMIELLEDRGNLHEQKSAKEAISKLRQLQETDLIISTEDEWEIRKSALSAIQEKKQDAIDEIEEKQKDILENLQIDKLQETLNELSKTSRETTQTFSDRQETLERRQTLLENTMKQIQELQSETTTKIVDLQMELSTLKQDMSAVKTRLNSFDEVELQHKKKLAYLQLKKDVKQELKKLYSKYLSAIPVPPLLKEIDARVDEFYMDLEICDDLVYERRGSEKIHPFYFRIRTFREIFYKENKRVENIFVLGDAGVGKTTWCLKLIDTWLQGNTKLEANSINNFSCNEKLMLEFDIVLFVSLRHATKELDLIEMIRNQIFYQTADLLDSAKEILKTEPEKCLVITDGLDEWNPSDDGRSSSFGRNASFPSRKEMNHCTVLTTSRSWKLNEARPSFSDIDRAVIIRGFEGSYGIRGLAKKVIDKLTILPGNVSSLKSKRNMEDFEKELNRRLHIPRFAYFPGVMKIPLIVIFMVIKWFKDGSLESCMAGNYSSLLENFFEHEEGYRNLKARYGRKKSTDGRLSKIPYIEEAKTEWSREIGMLPDCLKKSTICGQYSGLILKLSKVAFEGLFIGKSNMLVFSEEALLEKLTPEELEVSVKSGILSKTDVIGAFGMSKLSFLHKTVQEYMAAIYMAGYQEDRGDNALQNFEKYCTSNSRIYEMENVILFVCGLHVNAASKVLNHIFHVEQSRMCFNELDHISFNFIIRCIGELREASPDVSMPMFPFNSVILDDRDKFADHLEVLETFVDKSKIKFMKIDTRGVHGVEHKLTSILSSEQSTFSSLTILKLNDMPLHSPNTETNPSLIFHLHNLRNLTLTRININTADLRYVVLDFSHSKNIEKVSLSSIDMCKIYFAGSKLTELKLEHLRFCNVCLNEIIVLQSAEDLPKHTSCNKSIAEHAPKEASSTELGKSTYTLQCDSLKINCIDIQNCSTSEVHLHSPNNYDQAIKMDESVVSSLFCKRNRFFKINIVSNIIVESIFLIRNDTIPNIAWQKVKSVVLKGAISEEAENVYIDVLKRIRGSQNLLSIRCIGCSQTAMLELVKTIKSGENVKNVGIISHSKILDINKDTFGVHGIKHLALAGLSLNLLDNSTKTVPNFISVETLELSNIFNLPKQFYHLADVELSQYDKKRRINSIKKIKTVYELNKNAVMSVRSLVNIRCLKCQGFTEGDFIALGECFQYLERLEDLDLSFFQWEKVENPSVFSCLANIKNLKTLSLWHLFHNVTAAIAISFPSLSLTRLKIGQCFLNTDIDGRIYVMSPAMLPHLTVKKSENLFFDFIHMISQLKQLESLTFLELTKKKVLRENEYHIDLFNLSELTRIKHFVLKEVHINMYSWQKFVTCLPTDGRLQTLELHNAVIQNEKAEQMIRSIPVFVSQEWECIGFKRYNVILKTK